MRKTTPQRELKAQMALKDLSLRDVSRLSKVEYVRCCEVLNGTRIDPERLSKIAAAIHKAPTPKAILA